LGEALDIARKKEGFLTPDLLPTDFDEVIKIVRNNLIHLSSEALNTPLNNLDPTGEFNLGTFIERADCVYDLLRNISIFINEQYIQLA
jgi:hypothetical protein